MENFIYVNEKNNILELNGNYTPLVCGNTNYFIKFNFSGGWEFFQNKLAVFEVDLVKTIVEFSGDIVQVPILPNGEHVIVNLMSANGERRVVTTPLKLRLVPSPCGGQYAKFDQLGTTLQKIVALVNRVECGDLTIKKAETAKNVVNPNLLVNGGFRINQRGRKKYTKAGSYTADRWKLLGGELEVICDGVKHIASGLNSGIEQSFVNAGYLSEKTITFSAGGCGFGGLQIFVGCKCVAEKIITISGEVSLITKLPEIKDNDRLSFRLVAGDAESEMVWHFAKVEYGCVATEFRPIPEHLEIDTCKKFYFEGIRVQTSADGKNFNSPFVETGEMRTVPTVQVFAVSESGNVNTLKNTIVCCKNKQEMLLENGVTFVTKQGFTVGVNENFENGGVYRFKFVADAEIY